MKQATLLIAVFSIFGCKAFQVPKTDSVTAEKNKIEKYKSYIAMVDNSLFTGKAEYLKLSEANYKINYTATGYTTQAKSENLSYLLASELCYEDGYKYFIIPPNDSNSWPNQNGANTSSGPGSTILIKCVEEPATKGNLIIYESEVLIKSICEKYDKLRHMNFRYPNIK